MTTELAKDTAIKNLVATDLSIKFLKTAKSRVSEASNNVYFVACDANHLPFLSEFDCVMGHSILHHILDYESTLKASYKILPKGGFAAFFEPVIQAKIFILFLITLLENFDNLMKAGEITPENKINLNHFKNNVLKGKKYAADSKFISSLEDKYIFDIESMIELGKKIGYSDVLVFNNAEQIDLSYKSYIINHLRVLGITLNNLSILDTICTSFTDTYAYYFEKSIVSPMVWFYFLK